MKNIFLSFALLSLGGLLAAGCGSSTAAGGGSITCESNPGAAGHTCDTISVSCAGCIAPAACPGGTKVTSCPTANKLGTCSYSTGTGVASESFSVIYYSDGNFTAASAQTGCTALPNATWTAG